ncbi:hypothetical protein BVX98_04135 [bacterium F11]|nr:hypothetical protein BVX98_04135 [bacterium F11]
MKKTIEKILSFKSSGFFIPIVFPPYVVISGLCLCWILGLGILGYSNLQMFWWYIPFCFLAIFLGYRNPLYFLCCFILILPLAGFLNAVLSLKAIHLLMPIFLSGCIGRFLRKIPSRSGDKIILPKPVWIFLVVFTLFAFFSILSHVKYIPDWKRIVAHLPWAEVPLANAFGWIMLSFLNLIAGILFFEWVLTITVEKKNVYLFIKMLMIGIIISFLFGLGQVMRILPLGGIFQNFFLGGSRYNTTFIDPSSLGIFCALSFAIWLGYILYNGHKIYWICGPMLMFLILISGSRSAVLLGLVGILVFVGVTLIQQKKFSIFIICISLFVFVAMFNFHKKLNGPTRITNYVNNLASTKWDVDHLKKILGDRVILWQAGWVTFKKNPIFGVGTGQYLMRMPEYKDEISMIVNDNSGNMYLHIAAENGVLGLIVFIYLLGTFVRRFVTEEIKKKKIIEVASFSSFIGLLVAIFFGGHLLSFSVSFLFWFQLAIFAPLPSYSRILKDRSRQRAKIA